MIKLDKNNLLNAKAYGDYGPVLERNQYDYVAGKVSVFEMRENNLSHILHKNREEGRKRYKDTPKLLKKREEGIKK